MKMTFRWYGQNDAIPLNYIKQIPNMSGVVTACYDVPAGGVWKSETLEGMRALCNAAGLAMEVIESIPVHEDIKLGKPSRDGYIANYAQNIRAVADAGVKCVCYNFMPVFDWLRTNLKTPNADGSNALSYSHDDFARLDPQNLRLPGWDESYSREQLQELLGEYKSVTRQKLFDNLIYFLKKVIPVCVDCGVNMAIHPDDPPWDVFGLPRIVSREEDLDNIFSAVPELNNGLTFCTGSLGAGRFNGLASMAAKYAKRGRIHFAHLRNIKYTDAGDSFCEVAHYSDCGSLDMAAIVRALVQNGFNGYVRPDHGRNIWGEDGKPGYGLYDRALGAAYLNGLFEAVERPGQA
ncbi:MAG: mannonate dehydratase [Clostridiales bacterium]|jgi:mannonate dehydratase|nr:mannonate dehydratase [Clostridiales bacterium]